MLRKLAVFIVSAGLTMSPLSVQALGFGGIKLKSSLNEKLNAEVALLSASANDIQSLKVSLASEEAFLRSGIDRTALLNKLRFKVKQNSSGDYYIHVTTTETVREPFMNFLLEMNWKNGRMLREYTMLIDPPGRSAPKQFAEPAPVIAETVEPEPEVEMAPEMEIQPEPMMEEAPMAAMTEEAPVAEIEAPTSTLEPIIEDAPLPEINPEAAVAVQGEEPAAEMVEAEPVVEAEEAIIEEPVEAEPEMAMEEPVAVEPAMEQMAEPMTEEAVFTGDAVWPRIPLAAFDQTDEGEMPVSEPVAAGELDYGITKANDNLWNIAEKLRGGDESVTVHQVMMALLQSNPDAFVDNNVHRLKVGHVLRINDPALLTSMSRQEASKAYVQQTQEWNDYRQQVAGTTTVQPIMAGESSAAASAADTPAGGELTLAAPDGESLTAGGGANEETLSNDLATMQDQLRQAKADSGTMRTRNVELNNKLQSLEQELNRLQRSLSVKDDELAALQQQLASLNAEPVVEPAKPEPTPAEVPVPPDAAEPVAEEPAQPEVVEAPAAEEPATPDVAAPVAEEPAKVEEPAKAEETKPAAVEPPPAPPAPTQEPGIMDTVMGVVASIGATIAGIAGGLGGDSLIYIAAPIALILLIIVLIVVKRRRSGDNFQESILTGAATADADAAGGVPSGDSTTFSEESSFLSDFAMSGASAIEADDSEVDPLTEADVFMAYGRYEAAEERLNEAISKEPNRMELRAKLLELYHATQNKDAFESSAEDFYASLGGEESPLWDKVKSMGSEIAPGNPLFNTGGGAADIPATASPAFDDPGMGMTDSQVMDIGLETGVFAAADLGTAPEAEEENMDFNLDLGDSAAAEPAADMDFNLDIGGATEEATPDMDFNLDIGGGDAPAGEAPDLDLNLDMETSETADAGGLDFNLDMGSEEAPAEDLGLNLDMGSTETADAGGLEFDLDIGGETESADAGLDFDTGSSDDGGMDLNLDASDTADADIGGGDEVGTKLDLAKAYIDMGDPEGARSILDEVMDEGSSTQKEEAQSLLGQIA